ncbi:MAG: GNAT family N-acetyltransferase [Gammaproteobacteria bacterium]|nr:GNAT family N-acetyltransferase [Gammaproteobacteria bacterium]
MRIALAANEDDTKRCYPVMAELRPHLSEAQFLAQVTRQRAQGYQLVYLEDGQVHSVAGFRVMEMLAFGKLLYVDDLITVERERSRGFGDQLFDWLVDHARQQGCECVHLDSGVHRFAAHRFYLRKRMEINCHHFALKL